jgi:hypothetical protein
MFWTLFYSLMMGQQGPKHEGVCRFCNITVNLRQFCAFFCLNYSKLYHAGSLGWEFTIPSPNFQARVFTNFPLSLAAFPLHLRSCISCIENVFSILNLRTQHTLVQDLPLIITICSNERNVIFSAHLMVWDCAVYLIQKCSGNLQCPL